MLKTSTVSASISVAILVIILVAVICYIKKTTPTSAEQFLAVDSETRATESGALVGQRIFTDGMIGDDATYDGTSKQIMDGQPVDEGTVLGGVFRDGFDAAYAHQLATSNLRTDDVSAVRDRSTLQKTSEHISASANNSSACAFSRGGIAKAKTVYQPNAAQGIIPGKYIPDRDKNYQIRSVGSVFQVAPYDIDTSRIGKEFNESSITFANVGNRKTKHKPSMLGSNPAGGSLDLPDSVRAMVQ